MSLSRLAQRLALQLIAFVVALGMSFAASAQDFPARGTAPVVDAANIIDPAAEAELTAKLDAFEQRNQRQFVVATIPDLQGYDISDYGYQLGRKWGIGSVENNDGALLLVAPNERKVRVEVGYGLEGIMTDALSSIIIQNDILPRFRDNDYPAGIMAGVDALSTQLTLPEDQARQYAAAAAQQVRKKSSSSNPGLIIFWVFILIFFVLPILFGRGKGRRYRGGAGPIVMWGPGMGGGSSRGSSWGGGEGFGGGGFGGGGGSFGGGGASGGW